MTSTEASKSTDSVLTMLVQGWSVRRAAESCSRQRQQFGNICSATDQKRNGHMHVLFLFVEKGFKLEETSRST